jgi:hypothetical protein
MSERAAAMTATRAPAQGRTRRYIRWSEKKAAKRVRVKIDRRATPSRIAAAIAIPLQVANPGSKVAASMMVKVVETASNTVVAKLVEQKSHQELKIRKPSGAIATGRNQAGLEGVQQSFRNKLCLVAALGGWN